VEEKGYCQRVIRTVGNCQDAEEGEKKRKIFLGCATSQKGEANLTGYVWQTGKQGKREVRQDSLLGVIQKNGWSAKLGEGPILM